MRALVTGASSGIGYSIARYLSNIGYDLVVVARREDCLLNLKKECKTDVKIIVLDLSIISNMYKLHEMTSDYDIDIVVNNAGVGLYGEFYDIDSSKEISMLNLNVIATDLITKLYLKDMVKKNRGRILNVSSVISFMPGPLMSSYYASKAYITSMSRAINTELKMKKINVTVSTLCAGAVDTNFNSDLGISFFIPPSNSEKVAKYAVNKLLKNNELIIPGTINKIVYFGNKIIPISFSKYFVYMTQNGKRNY
ncbi:MAG: SDR family NAD(P)-dependent oxidoreductase [Clostridia bacterium]|nr:SDR family NAD(P)-dependent oxidoreductase [Clostridia bacterium]